MVERLRIAVGKGLAGRRGRTRPWRPAWRGSPAGRWCWRWCPATSASSTIDSLLSLSRRPRFRRSSSSRLILAVCAARHKGGAQNAASAPRPSALSAKGAVLAALDDGRSISVSPWRRSPMQLAARSPPRSSPLKAIARRSGKSCEQLLDPIVVGERGSPGRGCRAGVPSRSRPTGRSAARPGARAARHKAARAAPRRSPIPSSRQNWFVRMRIILRAASDASPGRLPRMNSRASGRAIGGRPVLTLHRHDTPRIAFAAPPLSAAAVQPNDLRVALFSGNYNYVRDGANQALNRLVGYLLRQGVKVRVYSPTVDTPAFQPTGDLVSIPSVPIPGRVANIGSRPGPDAEGAPRPRRVRPEHRPYLEPRHRRPPRGHLGAAARDRGRRLGPHAVRHLSRLLSSAVPRAARARDHAPALPPLRRDPRAGGIDRGGAPRAADEPRHLHLDPRRRPRAVQSRSGATWSGGAALGIADDELVIAFLGRHRAWRRASTSSPDAIDVLAERRVKHRVAGHRRRPGARLVRGAPARTPSSSATRSATTWPGRLPAPTSSSTRRSPRRSATSRWRRWPARCRSSRPTATGATNLVRDGENGILVEPGDADGFADALEAYARDPELRATPRRSRPRLCRDAWTGTGSTRSCSRRLPARDRAQRERLRAPDRPLGLLRAVRSAAPPRRGWRRSRAAAPRPSRRGRRGGVSAAIRFSTARPIAAPPWCDSLGAKSVEPLEQRLDLVRFLLEMRAALVGDLERLARPFARGFLDQAHVLRARSASDRRRPGSAHIRRRSAPRSRGSGRSRGAARRRSASAGRGEARRIRTCAGSAGRRRGVRSSRCRRIRSGTGPSRPTGGPSPNSASGTSISIRPRGMAARMSVSHLDSPFDVSKIYLRYIFDKSAGAIFSPVRQWTLRNGRPVQRRGSGARSAARRRPMRRSPTACGRRPSTRSSGRSI